MLSQTWHDTCHNISPQIVSARLIALHSAILVPLLNCNASHKMVKGVSACNTSEIIHDALTKDLSLTRTRDLFVFRLNVCRCMVLNSAFPCLQIPPRLPGPPVCRSPTWRWATKAWWQLVWTGPCRRSPIFPYITTKCSGAGLCPPSPWCHPRRNGERPPTG